MGNVTGLSKRIERLLAEQPPTDERPLKGLADWQKGEIAIQRIDYEIACALQDLPETDLAEKTPQEIAALTWFDRMYGAQAEQEKETLLRELEWQIQKEESETA